MTPVIKFSFRESRKLCHAPKIAQIGMSELFSLRLTNAMTESLGFQDINMSQIFENGVRTNDNI